MAAIPHPFRGSSTPVAAPFRGAHWIVGGAIVAATLAAMLPVLQNLTTTSRGYEVQEVQARRATLEGQIGIVESDVARLTSLQRIEKRSSELGLFPASSPLYVTVDEAGPAPAKIPAEFLPPPERTVPAPESRWGSLWRWATSLYQ